MPLHKDEQFADSTDSRTSRTRRDTRQSYKRPEGEESIREDFYNDEHPEIPVARRASLNLDSRPSSSRYTATKARGIDAKHIRSAPPSPRTKTLEYEQESASRPTSKVGVSSHYRRQVGTSPLTPRPVSKGKRISPKILPRYHKRQAAWPFSFLPQFEQQRNWFTIGSIAIILFLISVLLGSISHNFFSQPAGTIILSTDTGTNTTNTNGSTPSDPHALVIMPVKSDHPTPPVYAQGAYLLDVDTGSTLYARNSFQHLPIMSTTKLMTALLAAEHGNFDQTVTLNGQIANDISHLPADSSNANLKAGESYTLRQLMYALLLASGNDAAIAIADTVGGSYANFVAMMNQKATELGLHDTHFQNPHGLQQPNHYSSAHDLAIIGMHSLSNPLVQQISATLNYHIDQSLQHPAQDYFNGSQFNWWYPGVNAGKPGYDAAANFVQVVSCIRNNHHLIGVTIHTINWWTDMRDLMNWGFNTYTWISPHDLNKPDHPIPYANLWNNFADDKKENTIATANNERYYIYTGYSIAGDIENYFDKNGGLAAFGFPLSQPSAVGTDTLRQRFEHGTIQCNIQSKKCQKGT